MVLLIHSSGNKDRVERVPEFVGFRGKWGVWVYEGQRGGEGWV